MKSVNLKSLLCVALLSCSMAVMAQPPQGGGEGGRRDGEKRLDPVEMAEKRTEKMATALGLSDAQKKKLLALNKEQAEQMKAEQEKRKQEQEDREAQRKEREAQQDKYNTDVLSLLNDEQKIEYAKMLSQMKQRQGESRGKQDGNGKPQR